MTRPGIEPRTPGLLGERSNDHGNVLIIGRGKG